MSRTDPAAEADLADAAAVHAAREAIVQALGPLAASPLDEQAAAQMRRALKRVTSPAVRRALRRLARPGESRPPLLVAMPTGGETAGASSRGKAPPALSCRPTPISAAAAGGAA